MGRIIGIDLGTTTSEIAYVKDGKPCIIRNIEEGDEHAIPSVVSIEGDEIKVGKKAKNQILLKPELTVAEVKRVMERIQTRRNFSANFKKIKRSS